jgi:uncharacterized membrane protein
MRPGQHEEPVRRDDHPGDGIARGTARMEAFADAVFAIALTLPVVEIELPPAGPDFAGALSELWPSYLGYALSALVIGTYWINHHFSGGIYRTTGHRFLVATLIFLIAIGFIAFPTRAFAEHIMEPEAREQAAQFYALALGFTSLAWWVKWRTGLAQGDVDQRLDPAYVQRLNRKYFRAVMLMVAATALAFVRWEAGLGLTLLITLSYLRSPETPVYRTEAPIVEGE